MKLREFKKWIDFCAEHADENTDPEVRFECEDEWLKIVSIGQFGVVPDVVVYLEGAS